MKENAIIIRDVMLRPAKFDSLSLWQVAGPLTSHLLTGSQEHIGPRQEMEAFLDSLCLRTSPGSHSYYAQDPVQCWQESSVDKSSSWDSSCYNKRETDRAAIPILRAQTLVEQDSLTVPVT